MPRRKQQATAGQRDTDRESNGDMCSDAFKLASTCVRAHEVSTYDLDTPLSAGNAPPVHLAHSVGSVAVVGKPNEGKTRRVTRDPHLYPILRATQLDERNTTGAPKTRAVSAGMAARGAEKERSRGSRDKAR